MVFLFDGFADDFGSIERVVVNAGIGDSRRIGKGHFETNRRTADVNFVAALAQCEAAMNIFRAQNSGHLVVISSMSAMRGLPRHLTTYGASKAGLAHLAEGIRAEPGPYQTHRNRENHCEAGRSRKRTPSSCAPRVYLRERPRREPHTCGARLRPAHPRREPGRRNAAD